MTNAVLLTKILELLSRVRQNQQFLLRSGKDESSNPSAKARHRGKQIAKRALFRNIHLTRASYIW